MGERELQLAWKCDDGDNADHDDKDDHDNKDDDGDKYDDGDYNMMID